MQSDYKMNRIGFGLISILLLSTTTTVFDVSSELIIRPTTIVEYFRVPIEYFNCSSTLGSNAITWTYAPFMPSGQINPNVTLIVNGSIVETMFTGVYAVEQYGMNTSNLIISLSYEPYNYTYRAGLFTCSDGSASNASAELMFFFRSGENSDIWPRPPSPSSNNKILEGELVMLLVYLVYAAPIQSKFTAYPIIRLTANNQTIEDININKTQPDESGGVAYEFGTSFISFWYVYKPTVIPIPECGHVPSVVYNLTVLGIMQNMSTENATELTYIPWTSLNINSGVTTFEPVYIYCDAIPDNITITGADPNGFISNGSNLMCSIPSEFYAFISNFTWTAWSLNWYDLTLTSQYSTTQSSHSVSVNLTVSHSGSYACLLSVFYAIFIDLTPTLDLNRELINVTVMKGNPSTVQTASPTTSLISNPSTVQTTSPTTSLISIPIGPNFNWFIEPTYGPISGGTRVNVSGWSNTYLNISSVYIGTNLQANFTGTDRLNDCLFILTPKTNESSIGKQLMVIIEFFSFNVSTNQYFTFLDDPQITDINPKKYIITGGTSVTVNGTSLNSVAKPFIRTTLVVNRSNRTNFTSTSTDTEEPCQVPSAYFGDEMFCTMPTINLPQDFLDILENMTSNYNYVAPSQISLNHSSIAQSIVSANGKDTADITLGFVFDGDTNYKNINSAIPSLQFQFFSTPGIQFQTGIFQFDPNIDDTGISIKGEHLQLGCQLSDYVVTIGNGICRNLNLTDNALDCEPPNEEPQRTSVDDIHCDSSSFIIMVNIGNTPFAYECLVYISDDDVAGLIVGLVVGLSFLMLIVIIIIFVVVKSRRRKQRHSKAAIHRDSNDPDSSTTGQSRVMSSNLNGFEGGIELMSFGNSGLRYSPGVATERSVQGQGSSNRGQPMEIPVLRPANQLLRRINEYSTEIDQFVPEDGDGWMTMDGSNIHSSSSSRLRPSTRDTLLL